MLRRSIFTSTALALLLSLAACENKEEEIVIRTDAPRFDVIEATITEMQAAMTDGTLTSRDLTLTYLARIATYENLLNATIAVNPNALGEAERLDRGRAGIRRPGPALRSHADGESPRSRRDHSR